MITWKNYPWTNFNELNLDWILRIIKEMQLDVIPALDKKIDDVYEYIKENLPDIVAAMAETVIDVTLHGVTGDGVTDDSDALEACLDLGNIFYFPPGTYRFKQVKVNKPVYMFGAGDGSIWMPIPKQATSNQCYNMADFTKDTMLSDLQIRMPDPPGSQSGTRFYTESIVRAENINHFHLERITIDKVYQTYYQSVATPILVDFEDREGMALYAHNVQEFCMNDCAVHDFAGDELIWIAQDRINFANGNIKITNCSFTDRSTPRGSIINVLGGTLIFTGNIIDNVNNVYTTGRGGDGGSLFNLMAANTVFSNNTFTNCICGNYVDFVEGFFSKSESVICTDNVFSGSSASAIKICAKHSQFSNNYIESAHALRIMQVQSPFYYEAGGVRYLTVPYCVDPTTVYTDYDYADIDNNTFVATDTPYWSTTITPPDHFAGNGVDAYICTHYATDTEPPSVPAVSFENINVRNNVFEKRTDTYTCYGTIYFNTPVDKANISGNYVAGAGISFPAFAADSLTYRSLVSGNQGCTLLVVNNNIIDASDVDAAEGIALVTGGLTFRSVTNYHLVYNSGIGNTRDHSGYNSQLGGFHADYEDLAYYAT